MNNMFYNLMKTNPMFKRAMEMSKGKSREENVSVKICHLCQTLMRNLVRQGCSRDH